MCVLVTSCTYNTNDSDMTVSNHSSVQCTRLSDKTHTTFIYMCVYGFIWSATGTSLDSVCFTLFTKKKRNPTGMALPPTSANLTQHILQAHLQVILWKAAYCQGPPDESTDIIQLGWEFRDNIPVQVIAEGNPTPPELLDVIRFQCKARGKKCFTEANGCQKQPLSCTTFCNCYDGEDCLNPLDTNRDIVPAAEEGPGTEDINNSLEDDSDDGLEQDIADGGDVAADELVSDYLDNVGVGIKIKPSAKEISSYICLSVRRKKKLCFC